MAWAVSTFPLHLQEKELFLKQWNDSMLLISEHTHHPKLTSQPPIVPRCSSETRSCSVKPSPPTVPFSTASSSAKTKENRKKSSGPQNFGFLRLWRCFSYFLGRFLRIIVYLPLLYVDCVLLEGNIHVF